MKKWIKGLIITTSVLAVIGLSGGLTYYFLTRKPAHDNYISELVDTGNYKKVSTELTSQLLDSTSSFSFDYSDEMFSSSSYELNTDLAKVAVALAAGSYNEKAIKTSLTDMGFSDIKQFWYDEDPTDEYYWKSNSGDYSRCAFSLAKKSATINGKASNIYTIIVRGTKTSEWYGDFDVGNPYLDANGQVTDYQELEYTHEGFDVATSKWVMPYVKSYLQSSSGYTKDNSYILITGHSRGAAVANLVGYTLNSNSDYDLAPEEQIFDFTYATPSVHLFLDTTHDVNCADYPARPEENKNIYNFANPGDYVPCMPLSAWGFDKYGTNVKLDTINTIYSAMKERFKTMTGYDYKGAVNADRFNTSFLAWAPRFYDGVTSKDTKYKKTPIEVMQSLAPFLSKDATFKDAMNAVGDLGYSFTGTGGKGNDAMMSLIDYAFNGGPTTSSGGFGQAHSLECYVSWINVMYLGDSAYYVTGVISPRYEEEATSVGTLAFSANDNLIEVTLSDNIKRIDSLAFVANSSLKNVIIGKGLTLIGERAFLENYSLENVYFTGACPVGLNEDTFQTEVKVHIPSEYRSTYSSLISGDTIVGQSLVIDY